MLLRECIHYKLTFFSQWEDVNKSPQYIASTYSYQYRFDTVCTSIQRKQNP